jgi:glucokinase
MTVCALARPTGKKRRTEVIHIMNCLLGLDIGGTKCAVILGRVEDGQVTITDRAAFATLPGPEANLTELERLGRTLLERARCQASAVGVSCGGPLDSRLGIIQSPPNLPGWDDVRIVERCQKYFGVPVLLQNDANACAVAEWKWGAGRGTRNMVFLTFGTGMGAGLILDGRLYSGTNDLAGEVGHLRLAEDGPEGYGKRGSFEGFCSGGGIARFARLRGLNTRTAQDIFAVAQAGDTQALALVEAVAEKLGQGLALIVDTLNPEAIVLGSIFARQREMLWPIAEKALRAEALPGALSVCRILPAELGDQIGDYAALALAAEASAR